MNREAMLILLLAGGMLAWWLWPAGRRPASSDPPPAESTSLAAASDSELCVLAAAALRRKCRQAGTLVSADCRILPRVDGDPGRRFGFGGGPVWVLDGEAIKTANGEAIAVCDDLGTVLDLRAPATAGCSAADVQSARVIELHLASANDPPPNDGDEMLRREARAFRRAAKVLGTSEAETRAIWERVDTTCPERL